MVGMKTTCEYCGCDFDAVNRRGITPKFCSNACRQKAYRARKAQQPLAEFHCERRWVRADGKRPIMPCGSPASSTDPATWLRFSDVQAGAGDGFGVMLGGGLGCYDLDHCIVDGALEGWALQVLDGIPEPVVFTEVSMSGTGLHVFVRAGESPGARRGNVERYTRARFIRVTGKKFVR